MLWFKIIGMIVFLCLFVCLFVCLFDGVSRHFQQYFNYMIMAVSFIGGGNRRTWGKPPIDKLYHIMLYTSP